MTDLINPTVLANAQRFIAALTTERGYDTARIEWIELSPEGEIRLCFTARDDFQSNVSHIHRYKSETCQHVHWPFLDALASWPTREERELRVLLAQQGESTALADEMKSASARRFVQNLCRERAEYAALCDFTSERD